MRFCSGKPVLKRMLPVSPGQPLSHPHTHTQKYKHTQAQGHKNRHMHTDSSVCIFCCLLQSHILTYTRTHTLVVSCFLGHWGEREGRRQGKRAAGLLSVSHGQADCPQASIHHLHPPLPLHPHHTAQCSTAPDTHKYEYMQRQTDMDSNERNKCPHLTHIWKDSQPC